nr:retrotransposable element Tf2 [Tanacetum cinerariifolium]
WKWDEISMDFVTGLPQTQRRHDAIWVVVDRLTKSAYFLLIHKDYSISKLAETFQQEIVRLHGTPSTIVSDRDPRFTSRFWKGLQKAWGTRLKFSTAFHPQTDGQTERTIQTLEDMLRFCALQWTGNWDDYICLVEFAYNNSWHASIKCAPFEMLYGRKCRALIYWDQVGERVIEGPEMIENLQLSKNLEAVANEGKESMVRSIEDMDDLFTCKLTNDAALMMIEDVSNAEIKRAMFDIADVKASGPDGFTACFLKKAWNVVEKDICDSIKDFFLNGKLLKEINSIIIYVVPKVPTPQKGSNIRPIACCKDTNRKDQEWVFCHGDVNSVKIIKKTIDDFSEYSGVADCKSLIDKVKAKAGD